MAKSKYFSASGYVAHDSVNNIPVTVLQLSITPTSTTEVYGRLRQGPSGEVQWQQNEILDGRPQKPTTDFRPSGCFVGANAYVELSNAQASLLWT